MSLRVLRPGPLTLVQDLGRPGLRHLGLSRSGAFDRGRATAANAAVGNHGGAAVLECLLGGLRIQAESDAVVAVVGPAAASIHDDRGTWVLEEGKPGHLPSGAELWLAMPPRGLRTYVAVRGGLGVESALGSRSRDQLASLGPVPLSAGHVLPIGAAGQLAADDRVEVQPIPEGEWVIPVAPGPRWDWLADLAALFDTSWTMSPRSDRIGIRLDGEPLRLAKHGQLPSEAAGPGAIQVPPSGEPIIFGPDHPATGGYPVVGVVTPTGLDLMAQARPGTHVRFAKQRWDRDSRLDHPKG